jgi:hypothetical protein
VFASALRNKASGVKAKHINNAGGKLELNRRRKMNVLLSCIALIFAVSWLPLNLFNILSDTKLSIIKPDHFFYVLNAVCILLGMSSAMSNPVLYGLLNENFKREYAKLFSKFCKRVCVCWGGNQASGEMEFNRNVTNNVEMARSSHRVLVNNRDETLRNLEDEETDRRQESII